jgi:hypothetical protein
MINNISNTSNEQVKGEKEKSLDQATIAKDLVPKPT